MFVQVSPVDVKSGLQVKIGALRQSELNKNHSTVVQYLQDSG